MTDDERPVGRGLGPSRPDRPDDPVDGRTEAIGATGHLPAPPTRGVPIGTVLSGRYVLQALLGRGATAEVFRGRDQLLARPVAVKVFWIGGGDATSVARQRTEMQVLAMLHHPNLVTVYDARVGTDETTSAAGAETVRGTVDPAADTTYQGPTYLVMELVSGGTLADRIVPGGLPPADVLRIGAAVADALDTVHSHGLVHRDIKPANILLTQNGTAKLSDFGIARELAAERLTAAADVIGTAAYLSPEQARGGEVGPPTDVYALGLVLLECLTGRREFPGKAIESAMARLMRDPVVPDELPAPWPRLLRAMTVADPRHRPTARQVTDALRRPGSAIGPVPPAGPTATLPQGIPVVPAAAAPTSSGSAVAAAGAGSTAAAPAVAAPARRRSASAILVSFLVVALLAVATVAVIALVRNADNGEPSPVTPTNTTTTVTTGAPTTPTTQPATSTAPTTRSPATTRTTTTTATTPTTPTTEPTTPTTPTTEPTTPTTPATPTTVTTPTTPTTPTAGPATTTTPNTGGEETGAQGTEGPGGGGGSENNGGGSAAGTGAAATPAKTTTVTTAATADRGPSTSA